MFQRTGRRRVRVPSRRSLPAAWSPLVSLEQRVLLSVATLAPAQDGYATDAGLNGTFDTLNTTSDNNSTRINNFGTSPLEDRSLMDFNIAHYSAGNQVNSAVLNVTASSITGPSGSSVIVDILAYARSGALSTADATAGATQVASVTIPNNVSGLATYAIPLDAQFVQGLLGNATDLGLVTRIDPNSVGYAMTFYSTRATYVPLSERPSLALDSTPTQPGLTVTTNVSSVAENAGAGAVTGTVTRQNGDLSQPLTVSLASSDTTEATVPSSVIIAAGASSATFPVSPVADTILDGTEAVTITASSAGYTDGSTTINVTDYVTLSISLAASTIAENAGPGATTGTVTRNNTNIDQPLTVNLSSSNTSQAVVPATVTIPGGKSSATFSIDAVDDIVVSGPQTVTITASAAGYAAPVSANLTVTDTDGGHIRPQDILVSTNNAGSTLALVKEYTTSGLFVQQYTAPSTEESRDLVVDENGQIQLYNGTFSPTLTTIDPATGNATEQTIPGLSTVNNVSFGGIATFHQFVYLTDMATAGSGGPQGVVRVDLTDRSWLRFATDKQFQDLTIGGDGLLYGLDGSGLPGNQVTVYNPVTMAQVRTFALPFNDYRGIAVSASGDVFASGWDGTISHMDSSGKLLASVTTPVNNLESIDLRSDGTLVVGSRFGDVLLADTSLNAATITHFNASSVQGAFAAFAAPTIFVKPTLDATPGSLSYTEDDPASAIDAGLLVTTDGEQLTGATVQIGAGFQSSQDVLGFASQNGIAGVYDAAHGTLTLSGAASANQYQAALRSVTYLNSSGDPDVTPRAITFSVTDGTNTVSAAKSISIIDNDVTAPLNLTASALSSTSAQLSWSAASDQQGYRVYQVTNAGALNGPVAVQDPSFETPALTRAGAWTSAAPTGWTLTGQGGVFLPISGSQVASVPDGKQVAWLYHGSLFQDLATAVDPSTTYQLKLSAGTEFDYPAASNSYHIALVAGGASGTVIAQADGTLQAKSDWVPISISGKGTGSGNLGIVITTSIGQPLFDNIQVQASSGQSPQTTLLTTLGAGATSYQATGLTPGSTATFMVEAFNGSLVADSSLASVTLPNAPVTGNIPVLDSSFETPGLTRPGAWTSTAPTGWTLTGQGGVFLPVLGSQVASVPDGNQVAWLYNGSLFQDLGVGVDPSKTYQLTLSVGTELDYPAASNGYQIALVAGGPSGTVIAQTSGTLPAKSGFVPITVSGKGLGSGNLGILITATGGQPLFDNVQVQAS